MTIGTLNGERLVDKDDVPVNYIRVWNSAWLLTLLIYSAVNTGNIFANYFQPVQYAEHPGLAANLPPYHTGNFRWGPGAIGHLEADGSRYVPFNLPDQIGTVTPVAAVGGRNGICIAYPGKETKNLEVFSVNNDGKIVSMGTINDSESSKRRTEMINKCD